MGEYASRGVTHTGPTYASSSHASSRSPDRTPGDRAREALQTAARQSRLVHAAIEELTAARAANDLATWKQVRSDIDRAIVQATRRFEETQALMSGADSEVVISFEQARRDLALDVQRVHAAEPPKGYAQVAREQTVLEALRAPSVAGFSGRRDAVRAELEQLAIADLRVLRARIASPQPQDELAAEIWKLGPELRREVSTFIESVDRRKARERAALARTQPVSTAPEPETVDTKLRAALEGTAAETELFAVVETLDPVARRALATRLRGYRPGSGDDIAARFVRLDAVVRERVFMQLAREKGHAPPISSSAHPVILDEAREAWSVAEGVSEVLRDKRRPSASQGGRFHASLDNLYVATSSTSNLTPAQRLEQFAQAIAELDPAIKFYQTTDEGRLWVAEQLDAELAATRNALAFGAAKDRVDRSVVLDGKLVEMPDDAHPHEQAIVLREILPKLIEMMKALSEQVLRANFEAISHATHHLMEGHESNGGLSRLLELQNILMLADGWLMLGDEELRHHLNEINGVLQGVTSFGELVVGVIEAAGAATLLSVSFVGALARLSGEKATAAAAFGVSRHLMHKLGDLVVGVELVRNALVVIDPHATRQQRVDSGANVATTVAWFAGKFTRGGAAAGFAASSAIQLGYLELNAAAYLFWQGNLGLTAGFMKEAFGTLSRDGTAVAAAARDLTACDALLANEHDQEKAKSLKRVADSMVATLGRQLDSLLDDCGNIPLSAGMARLPGTQKILREAFEPLMKYRGVSDPSLVAEGAGNALKRIMWIEQNASAIVEASAHQKRLEDVEAELEKAKEGQHAE